MKIFHSNFIKLFFLLFVFVTTLLGCGSSNDNNKDSKSKNVMDLYLSNPVTYSEPCKNKLKISLIDKGEGRISEEVRQFEDDACKGKYSGFISEGLIKDVKGSLEDFLKGKSKVTVQMTPNRNKDGVFYFIFGNEPKPKLFGGEPLPEDCDYKADEKLYPVKPDTKCAKAVDLSDDIKDIERPQTYSYDSIKKTLTICEAQRPDECSQLTKVD